MKLAEFLIQGQHLRQQDRTLAIAYFEQCLQNTTTDENVERDSSTTIRVLYQITKERQQIGHPVWNLYRQEKQLQI